MNYPEQNDDRPLAREPYKFFHGLLEIKGEPDHSLEAVDISTAISHALNKDYTPEFRAVFASEILACAFFCIKAEPSESGTCIAYVPSLVLRALRINAINLLFQKILRTQLRGKKYTLKYNMRQHTLNRLLLREEAVEIIYEYMFNADEITFTSQKIDELDFALLEGVRRTKSIWPHLDLRLRIPISDVGQYNNSRIISNEKMIYFLENIYKKTNTEISGYENLNSVKHIKNSLSRLRPISPLIYGMYGIGCFYPRPPQLRESNFGDKLIRFATQPHRLLYIAQLYNFLAEHLPGSISIRIPENVAPKKIEIPKLSKKVAAIIGES